MDADASQGVTNARRHRLLKSRVAAAIGDRALAATWLGKHDAMPGRPLPDGFPARAALEAAHYTAIEDLDGASADELAEVGIPRADAHAAIAAVAALL